MGTVAGKRTVEDVFAMEGHDLRTSHFRTRFRLDLDHEIPGPEAAHSSSKLTWTRTSTVAVPASIGTALAISMAAGAAA